VTKYIFVTGGVISGVGKGITTASIGRLLKDRGFKVSLQKIDPYLNVDAGTMSPYQHGEVFVTDDGAETDLDLGHYERFIDQNLTRESNLTTGVVYEAVIRKERKGEYLGSTVQVIPHITDEIKSRITGLAERTQADVAIIEIGGTVGDIESLPFLEAIRQMRIDVGDENVLYAHVTLVPFVGPRQEMKTKPTQHSVRELRSIGIQPDLIICRSKFPLSDEMIRKVSLFCDVPRQAVIVGLDTSQIYEIPMAFEEQGLTQLLLEGLRLPPNPPDHHEWKQVTEGLRAPEDGVNVAIVGKYIELRDAYLSVSEALKHGGIANHCQVHINWVDSEHVESQGADRLLSEVGGILVPGGFGSRGVEGKIQAIRYAREREIPFLGLCLGLQTAVIEFARDACSLAGAHSTEFDQHSPHAVIDLLPSQRGVADMGATMRLGRYECHLAPDSLAMRCYGERIVYERHRHRFEVNPKYHGVLAQHGLRLSGMSPDGRLVEIIELPSHPFFIASQFHPEFRSRPNRAHPLFAGFIRAAVEQSAEQ